MISTEKLNAKAKPMASHILWSTAIAFNIMTKQNKLVITVRAFFSEKYFFMFKRV
jgi:hypothetical protein